MNNLGELLETLRIARGWTQAQLEEQTGIRQGTLSRYENGLREPDPATMAELAKAFGVTTEFLQRGQHRRAAMAVDAHMRRRATAKASLWRQREAQLNEYRLHARALFEEVSLQAEQIVPRFDGEDPSAAARMTRMQWRMPVGPVRALMHWLEAAGCMVIAEDFGSPRLDGLSQWIDEHPMMLINTSAPTDRMRWTLAHELGHLVLHSEYLTGDVEAEADEFAAELLMPAESIRPSLSKPNLGKLLDLKQEWGVSIAALIQRAHTLKTITPAERTRLFKMLSAKGFRITEPGSERIPPEKPRLQQHLRSTLQAKGLTTAEIARIAGYPSDSKNQLLPQPQRLRVV
ncbi:ImmA/IrrE family metallo-endopeptidase [Mycobacterium simiae]|uniref:ImmA/IrrE family metallo-endopeptidase n=1 Tax=Mycobacterium simiae TaxID=1784 RepID=A0A5B1BKL6_MYCSI|nr:XRE family transcriptional regulator [Mycobacterium simiae]KAA1248672.1 ImmA/IrrE family metallo-endopeptidase [Mycobacterium simiae]